MPNRTILSLNMRQREALTLLRKYPTTLLLNLYMEDKEDFNRVMMAGYNIINKNKLSEEEIIRGTVTTIIRPSINKKKKYEERRK